MSEWRTDDKWKEHRSGLIVLELENKSDPFKPTNKVHRLTCCPRCDASLRLYNYNVVRWLILPP